MMKMMGNQPSGKAWYSAIGFLCEGASAYIVRGLGGWERTTIKDRPRPEALRKLEPDSRSDASHRWLEIHSDRGAQCCAALVEVGVGIHESD